MESLTREQVMDLFITYLNTLNDKNLLAVVLTIKPTLVQNCIIQPSTVK